MSDYDLPPGTPGFAEAQADYAARSRQAADLPGAVLDMPYGDHDRQRLDLFPAGDGAAALVFLRGGYWRVGTKDDRRFPATAWHPRGVTWIVPGYRLAPDATIPEIVDDARAALTWVVEHAPSHGVDPARMHLVGNSAGGHLVAMMAAEQLGASFASVTTISGLFDLVPLLYDQANSWMQMDRATAEAMSPILRPPPSDMPVNVLVGGEESLAFKAQSKAYAGMCRANGNPVTYTEAPGKHHIGIIGECGAPGTPVFDTLARMVGLP